MYKKKVSNLLKPLLLLVVPGTGMLFVFLAFTPINLWYGKTVRSLRPENQK